MTRHRLDLMRRFMLDLLYPNRCPCCGDFLPFDALVCAECVQQLPVFMENKICPRCGKDICICDMQPAYSACFCFCAYEGKGREGILSLKSGKNTNFAEYLGQRLADMLDYADITRADYIIPAPVTKNSRALRGCNQSALIAKPIAQRLSAKVLDILRCGKQSLLQHELNAAERAENVLNITAQSVSLKGKTVIFCDDILTTGSTALHCCSLLRGLGAENVYAAIGASVLYGKK